MNHTLILSLFPGLDLLGHAFELEWPGACVVRGPDLIFGSLSDIRRFHPPAGKFSGIIGGPPCQSFSMLAHLVRANGHEPRFGNLIPDFSRCIAEAAPNWFIMENVPAAPVPVVPGYGVNSFLLDNSALDGGDGFGLEQRRVRRFSFGMRGLADDAVPSLLRWIDLATFLLPDMDRRTAVTAGHDDPNESLTARRRVRRQTVLSKQSPVPVKIGGSGKVKKCVRSSVTSSNGGQSGRYRLADALHLQGLPEDFLRDAPFTAEGKLRAVANGVPIPMGRAIAKAILCATG